MQSPYKILGVSTSATQKQIKDAYRKLVIRYHPDINPNPNAEKFFKEVVKAYNSVYKHAFKGYKKNIVIKTRDIENIFEDLDKNFWKRVKNYKKSFARFFLVVNILNIIVNLFLIISFILFIGAFFWKEAPPSLDKIDEKLKTSPIITEEVGDDFQFLYNGINCTGVPISRISAYGLLLNKQKLPNPDSNIYTEELLLMFGDNIKNGSYLNAKISSNTIDIQDLDLSVLSPDNIINAEVFTNDLDIKLKLKNITENDQIYLSGLLFDYYPEGYPQWKNHTSRTIGVDKMQMVYINQLDLIKKFSSTPLLILDNGKLVIPILIALKIMIWFLIGHLEWIYFEKIFKN